MTTETRIKLSDIFVGVFLLGIVIMFLTVVVYYAMYAFFFEEAIPIILSLVVSLEIVELIFIMYLLYRRQRPAEGVS